MSTWAIPEHIQKLVPYVPGKPIEETQRELGLKKVIKLASNENPLGPSPRALLAIKKAMADLHRYPDASGFQLKLALSRQLKVSPEQILLGNGSNEVIDLLIRTLCVPGDKILTSQAAFIAYAIGAQSHGLQTVMTPLTADLRFDGAALLRALRSDLQIKMVFIANPNNPTGTYMTAEELENFLEGVASLSRSVVVVMDAAYQEYVTASDLPDPMEAIQYYPQVVVLRTFSKIYGLAGLRVGYGVGHPDLIAMAQRSREPFNVNSLALAGACAALEDRAFVKRAVQLNQVGLHFWEKCLSELKIPYWKSQGNFVLADVQARTGKTGTEIYQACLRQGVIFRPVANYGLPGALRISVGTQQENNIAAKVLKKVVLS